MLAGLSLQADVGSEAHDLPVVSAAGVRLAQAHDVAYLKFDGHAMISGRDYTPSV